MDNFDTKRNGENNISKGPQYNRREFIKLLAGAGVLAACKTINVAAEESTLDQNENMVGDIWKDIDKYQKQEIEFCAFDEMKINSSILELVKVIKEYYAGIEKNNYHRMSGDNFTGPLEKKYEFWEQTKSIFKELEIFDTSMENPGKNLTGFSINNFNKLIFFDIPRVLAQYGIYMKWSMNSSNKVKNRKLTLGMAIVSETHRLDISWEKKNHVYYDIFVENELMVENEIVGTPNFFKDYPAETCYQKVVINLLGMQRIRGNGMYCPEDSYERINSRFKKYANYDLQSGERTSINTMKMLNELEGIKNTEELIRLTKEKVIFMRTNLLPDQEYIFEYYLSYETARLLARDLFSRQISNNLTSSSKISCEMIDSQAMNEEVVCLLAGFVYSKKRILSLGRLFDFCLEDENNSTKKKQAAFWVANRILDLIEKSYDKYGNRSGFRICPELTEKGIHRRWQFFYQLPEQLYKEKGSENMALRAKAVLNKFNYDIKWEDVKTPEFHMLLKSLDSKSEVRNKEIFNTSILGLAGYLASKYLDRRMKLANRSKFDNSKI